MINHYWDSLIVPDWCKRPIPFRKCSRRYDFVFLVAKSFAIEMMPIEERNAAQPVSWAVVILTWKPLQKKDAISLCHGLRRWFQLARLLLGGDISQALTCQGEHSFWNVLPADRSLHPRPCGKGPRLQCSCHHASSGRESQLGGTVDESLDKCNGNDQTCWKNRDWTKKHGCLRGDFMKFM